jgi:hypothetical protein
MARARNIKPSLFKNEVLGVADPLYTILFEGLWVLADRDGRLEDRPLRIKGEVFPYREGVDINSMLDWLQAEGFIKRYVVGDVRCIVIVNFTKHQNPHKNESVSELPSPEQAQESSGATSEKIGSTRADSLNLIPDSPSLIPESLNAQSAPVAAAPEVVVAEPVEVIPAKPAKVDRRKEHRASDDVKDVFAYWQLAMGHQQAKLDDKRAKAIGARLSDGYSVADLCQAVDGCKLSPFHMGDNEQKAIHDDIELICRNGPKVDGFIKRAKQAPLSVVPTGTTNQQKTIAGLQRYLERSANGA